MEYKNAIRNIAGATVIFCATGLTAMTTVAQEATPVKKPVVAQKTSGRDPFKKYVPVVKPAKTGPSKLEAPSIQVRIDRYRAQKLAAASAHVSPPKPTSVLLLNEMQVIGIFRTPRGFAAMIEATPVRSSARQNITRRLSWLEILANWPLERLVGFWLGMIVVFGLIYWLAGLGMGWGLQAGNHIVEPNIEGLGTAIYFSFVTALSIGYGDVIPTGALRIPAVIEGVAGLLIFGCVISKLVSRRQEELTEEIHRTTFEERLDRVRTNLHLVFSDLGVVQQLQLEQGALSGQVLRRLESSVRVFRGELQTIHDLLYASRMEPDEESL